MRLVLKIQSYQGLPYDKNLSVEVDEKGGTIGRKDDRTLILEDLNISREHAEIFVQNGQFMLRDTSTGGSFLVNKSLKINKNDTAVLAANDLLRIGYYDILIDIIAEQVAAPFTPFSPLTPKGFEVDQPVAPFAPAIEQSSVFASFTDTPAPVFPFSDPVVSPSVPFATSENLTPINASFPFSTAVEELPPTEPFPIHDITPIEPAFGSNIPLSFFGSPSDLPFAPIPTAPPEPAELPVNAPFPPVFSVENNVISNLFDSPFQNVINNPGVGDSVDQPGFRIPNPVAASSIPQAINQNNVEPKAKQSEFENQLISQFLLAAGVSDVHNLPPEQTLALMASAGSLLKCLVAGLMGVLKARTEMKSELRVGLTTIRGVDNNPLKFSSDVEAALKNMLLKSNAGYQDANQAVNQAYQDIINHQMAMTSGINAALSDVLQRFNPALFENDIDDGLFIQKKSKCWEHYCKRYPELIESAIDDFFGTSFADAYENKIKKS